MKDRLILVTIALCIVASLGAGEERTLLARFEVVSTSIEGQPGSREAVIFYMIGADVEMERMGISHSHRPVSLGETRSARLLARLSKINFLRLNYKTHFDGLRSKNRKTDRGRIGFDGQEVEFELRWRDTYVYIREWHLLDFLESNRDDVNAANVLQAIEALILAISMGTVFLN